MGSLALEDMNKINHDNVSNLVVENVKQYILANNLTSGDKLPTELELSSVLNASRASIREAMKILEGLGIIESIHGKGRYIRDFNYDQMVNNLSYNIKVHFHDFNEVFQVRIALEEHFLPLVADRLTDNDYHDLECILLKLENEVKKGKLDYELIETHTEFHNRIYSVLSNKLLDSLISLFATFQRMLSQRQMYKTKDFEVFIDNHRKLLASLRTRDKGVIIDSLKNHFTDLEDIKVL